MSKNIGVLLSGCGVFDGCEIHEAVITLLAIDRHGARAVCMAPDIPQHHVINHLTQEETDETRNVLVESARIARGEITDIAEVSAGDLDALIIPGGFGAAKNLSNFAFHGPDGRVIPEVKRIINEMLTVRKPIGAVCIAPAALAIATDLGPELTIGNDPGTAAAIEKTGATHKNCPVEDIIIDEINGIVSTPAYMLGPGIKDVAAGIEKLVAQVISMA